ncbi:MAG: M20/M25/M40 family metallo-hydrolase [Elusimicrobiales bacterium]|nr:M20/M25/M40 family metallo-hydrolase [Elusimicrobiales bacterium]
MISRRLLDLFLELARIDGLPGKEDAVAKRVFAFISGLGLPAQMDGAAAAALSGTSNVVCRVGGGGGVLLLAHMDTPRYTSSTVPVVTADRVSADGKNPLGADARAGMAAMLYALERAVNTNLPLKPFTLAFTTKGRHGMAGAKHLALPGTVRCGFVFDAPLAPGAYTASSHGVALFSADVLGRAADAAAEPEKGICAISIAARALAALKFGRHDEQTTSNIGTIAGGSGPDTVPLAAMVRGQVRAAVTENAGPVLDRIKAEFEAAAAAAGGAAAFKWSWEFAPYSHPSGAEVRLLADEAIIAAGLAPAPVPAPGGSEANALNARGIAAVNLGIGVKNPQSNSEYLPLDHLAKASEIALQLMKK